MCYICASILQRRTGAHKRLSRIRAGATESFVCGPGLLRRFLRSVAVFRKQLLVCVQEEGNWGFEKWRIPHRDGLFIPRYTVFVYMCCED